MAPADVADSAECEIVRESDLIQVRQILRTYAVCLSPVDQVKLITAGSELSRNILKYAGPAGGHMQVSKFQEGKKRGVRVVFTDRGPGIADIAQAMQDGFSTGGSLGLGLPGARRLVDEFTIHSVVGEGTSVSVVKWMR